MKHIVMLFTALTLGLAPNNAGELSKKERRQATRLLETSMKELFKGIENLSEEQFNYKPSDGGWSIAENCEHLLIAERGFFPLITQKILKNEAFREAPADGEKVTDQQVIDFINDRSPSKRVTTRPQAEPKGEIKAIQQFVKLYQPARQRLMDYASTSDDELKNYYYQSPAGKISAYQWLLLAGAHTQRHFAQIKEVMEDPGYPSL